MSDARRVLMVSPHFPPDSSAASHRVRLLAPHLQEAGWSPTVVTLEPSAYEGRLDPELAALVPSSLRIVRATAWPAAATRAVGLGDLGLRGFTGLRRACRSLLRRERFDALFITVYPVYPALFGAGLKAEFRLPFVLDYQDPWVGAWGLSVGGGPGGAPDWKSRASRWIGTRLEPSAVNAADALVAVSQGTIDGIVERIPAAARLPHRVIPLGFEPSDFATLSNRPPSGAHVDPADGNVHLCYVGTLLPSGVETLRLLLRALERARRDDPAAARLRLHFVGTSNQSESSADRVLPIARDCGQDDWNALHRDLYGDLIFPLQVVINLSEPGTEHTGGEFLLVEQRPRAQSRGAATLLPRGHGYVFTTRDRPVRSVRGWTAAPVRHGVSVIRSGHRYTLGLVFHDAA